MKKFTSMLLVLVMVFTLAPLSISAADAAKLPTEDLLLAEDLQAESKAEAAKGTPTASVSEGTYSRSQYVALSSEIEGAEIYYTTDGSEPTVNSRRYVKEIRILKTTTLKAIAVKDGEVLGDVMSVTYTITTDYKKIITALLASMLGKDEEETLATQIEGATLTVNGDAVSVVNVGDIITLVTDPTDATGTITWTVGGTVIANSSRTYTVTNFDMGKTIEARIEGTDSFDGSASARCTVANTTTVQADAIMDSTAVDSSPVVLTNANETKFLDESGEEVAVDENSTLSLTIETTEKEPEDVAEATEIVVQKFASEVAGVDSDELTEALSDVEAVAVDVDLKLDDTPVHPVGEVTVTLSAAQLGLEEGTDLTKYVFKANHTNKEGTEETVDGTVVTIEGVQYVRFVLNGLSTIWIGNVPPRTVSFYNTESDADNKVNSIGSVIVKFGDLTPTLQIPTPSRTGHLFCGWNYDMTRTPIIYDLEVHALWVQGEKMPASKIAAAFNKSTSAVTAEISDGLINIESKDGEVVPAGLTAEITVTAPANAVKYYVGTNAAVVAAFDEAEGYLSVNSNEEISFEVNVTNADGLMIAASTKYYYKWIDESGEVISLQEVEAKIANGSDTATSRTYTVDVNRGVGTFEAYLIDTDGDAEDYVAYINNNLSGDLNGYTLHNNVSFDGYKTNYDFSPYDTLKFVFTPFDGDSYSDQDIVSAEGEYYDGTEWNEEWTAEVKVEDGALVISYPFDTETMSNGNVTAAITVNDVAQTINIRWDHNLIASTSEAIENITCETWAEVLEALKSISSDKRYVIHCTDSSAITLSDSLTLPANVDLYLTTSPSFTVASGAVLTLVDDRDGFMSCGLYIENGDFIVADGGVVTTAYVGEDHGSRHYPALHVNNILFKAGANLTLPENTLLSVYCYNHSKANSVTFENGSVINNDGILIVSNYDTVNLNGTINSTYTSNFSSDEINIGGDINHTVNGYGYFELYGTVTVEESGSVVINNTSRYKYTNLEIYGPLTNKGTIAIKGNATSATIMNNGFVNYNMGTISVAAGCSIETSGTKLINTGMITGDGVLNASLGDDYTNYDDGTEYVNVENDGYWDMDLGKWVYTLSEYTRYKYTHDPAETVDIIVYLAEVVNMGAGQCTLTINADEFPQQ